MGPVDAALGAAAPTRRRSSCLPQLRGAREALGPAEQLLVQRDAGTRLRSAVSTSWPGAAQPDSSAPDRVPGAMLALKRLLDVDQPLVGLGCACAIGLVSGDHPACDQRSRVAARARWAVLLIRSYISGWVKAGSSPSLWP